MCSGGRSLLSFARNLIVTFLLLGAQAYAAGSLLIVYGSHNETTAPPWVGIESGLFRKYGVDPQMLQVRSGQIIIATLATGGVAVV